MRLMRLAAIVLVALFTFAGAGTQSRADDNPHPNWLATVRVTADGSHVMGNPDAKLKLTEYISYTCPHCAAFFREGDGPLRLAYVVPGKLSVEVRHMIRDPIDLAVAMLTNCGSPAKFFANHAAFLSSQDKWMKALADASDAQKQRWTSGSLSQRMRAIASDFGFYEIMDRRGYSRTAVDRCLSDEAMAKRLAAQTANAEKLGVEGTPSFLLNGDLLAGTHNWASLEPQLDARL
jgi:protein-disulfide isomerase